MARLDQGGGGFHVNFESLSDFEDDKRMIEISNAKKLNLIKEEDLFKRFKAASSLTEKMANHLRDGKYYLFNDADAIEFKNSRILKTPTINWKYKHHHSLNTYQVYLHNLDLLTGLSNEYKRTNDIWLLEQAHAILKNWIKYDKSKKIKSPAKMWADHPAAARVLNIVFFYATARDVIEIDESLIYDILTKHANFLYQNKNYTRNNHGIMMDRSLILLSLILENSNESKDWRERALVRIKDAFNRDFSQKGTHLENSPTYHRLVMNLFISTERFLKQNDLSLGEAYTDRLKLAKKYLQYITKPDKTLPTIGDAGKSEAFKIKKVYDNFFDSEAGIAILQDENKSNPELSTWISFICGYGSKTHKHNDDLSFNLFWKGKDIFVDAGKYSYDKNNKYRQYVISPLAHNTLTVKSENYSLDNPIKARENIRIIKVVNHQCYDLIKAQNLNYKHQELSRTLIFFKPNIVIIFDEIISRNECTGLQLFNLAPNIEILKKDKQSVQIKSENDLIEIRPLLEIDDLNVYYGDLELPRAVISEKFAQVTAINQLEFSKKGTEINFLTLIMLGTEGNTPNITHHAQTKKLEVEIKGGKYDIFL